MRAGAGAGVLNLARLQSALASKPYNPTPLPQGVYVPEMCVELTTRRVLVMEWVDGVRLRSAAAGAALPRGRDDLRLVEIGVHCSLEQARRVLADWTADFRQ